MIIFGSAISAIADFSAGYLEYWTGIVPERIFVGE
jgi:hypothetical protein